MLPQFDITTYPTQIFWLFISFFSLYGFIQFYAVPQIEKILNQRLAKLKADYTIAEEMISQATEVTHQNQVALAHAQEEARQILKSAQADILAGWQQHKETVNQACHHILKQAQHDTTPSNLSELDTQAQQLCTEFTRHILSRSAHVNSI